MYQLEKPIRRRMRLPQLNKHNRKMLRNANKSEFPAHAIKAEYEEFQKKRDRVEIHNARANT